MIKEPKEFVFAEITFTGEKVWGEIKPIRPTIGLANSIYTIAFFPLEKLRYEAYLYFSTIAKLKLKNNVQPKR